MSVLTNINTKGITYNHQNPWEHLSEVAAGLSGLGKVGDAVASYGKHKGLQDAYDAVQALKEEGLKRKLLDQNISDLEAQRNDITDSYEVSNPKPVGKFLTNEGLDKNGIKALQENLGVTADGIWGKQSQAALDAYNANEATKVEPSERKMNVPSMLGYLDNQSDYHYTNDGQRDSVADSLNALLQERESLYGGEKFDEGAHNQKLMEYALVMKSLGDSSLYDELVSKRNYEQTERNNKASSEDKGLSNDEATKMYDEAMTNIDILSTKKGLDVNVAAEGLKDANNAYKALLRANTPYSLQLAKELKVKIDGIESTASGNEEAAKQTRQNKANKAAQEQMTLNDLCNSRVSNPVKGSVAYDDNGSIIGIFDGTNWNKS